MRVTFINVFSMSQITAILDLAAGDAKTFEDATKIEPPQGTSAIYRGNALRFQHFLSCAVEKYISPEEIVSGVNARDFEQRCNLPKGYGEKLLVVGKSLDWWELVERLSGKEKTLYTKGYVPGASTVEGLAQRNADIQSI